MAVCSACNGEMTEVDSCELEVFRFPDGVRSRIRYGREGFVMHADAECHDCGVLPGGIHHPGCDMEVCPICGGQAIWDEHLPSLAEPCERVNLDDWSER